MAGISEAITQIKKAESDADSLVEQSTVDAKAMIDEATVKANEMIELAKNEASEEAQSTVFNANLLLLKQKKMLKASKMTQEKI